MRRVLLIVMLLGMVFAATPAPAVAGGGREKCEAYCSAVGILCYFAVGWLVGRDKCDAQYSGCMAGCLAVINEE